MEVDETTDKEDEDEMEDDEDIDIDEILDWRAKKLKR